MKGLACVVLMMALAVAAADEPTEAPVKVCDAICPNPPSSDETEMFPVPGNCAKYCMCVPHSAIEKDCPPGLHFNAEKKVCDWPWDAGCDPNATPPSTL